ncbi:hypothetical protein B0H17DRAFT_1129527 [Mycena rosella]|uniref:SUZ domain-containing protein n=1 Tax=Mycena rosella TaxID=1033263 RepID=A0AAD7DU37_MYCRO|nr:hypothetical protein B0H17DRAFT_1129527 [Mycena rosella]
MSPPPSSSSNSSVSSLLQVTDAPAQQEIDPQILEALAGKDRIYVLKLGELMEALITDRTLTRQRIDLLPATSYQRMLVHRCSAYYGLCPETDSLTKAITVLTTSESRIPPRRIAEIAPPPAEAPVRFKIMMRNPRSQTGSVAGDDGDISDVEASETGSLGGRSSASTSKHRLTIEERTAAYNEARNRIFIDFEEKEHKDTTSSASSSASLVSGSSTSASDDPGSPATESEWSGPSAAKKQPPHRANSTSSSRSLRSSAPAFMSSNGSSSRNSRAPSPAFKYPSLYEPPPQGANGNSNAISISVPPYDPAHAHAHSAPNFQAATPPQQQQQQQQQMQFYPYSAHSHSHPHLHPQQPPYIAPYHHPYYPAYPPYSHPPTPGSDPEVYAYNPYPWGAYPQPQNGAPNQNQNGAPNQNAGPQQQQQHGDTPPQTYPAYGSPPAAYPAYDATPTTASPPNGVGNPYAQPYYPHGHIAMPPYMAPPPPPQAFEPLRTTNGRGSVNGNGGGNGRGRGVNGNGTNHNNNGGGGKGQGRGAPPQRSAWSYGPGVSGGVGVDFPSSGAPSAAYPPLMRDAVGPRLSGMGSGLGAGMRRMSSGARTTSGSGDDVSSVASSSTTSSSSRRTYTSTTSSTQHHPLPARPDWAVGLRPNPTLHAPRHAHDAQGHHSLGSSSANSRTMSPISPPRPLNGAGSPHALSASSLRQQQQQELHASSSSFAAGGGQGHAGGQQMHSAPPPAPSDFPPLTLTAPEKPRVAGAWTNSGSARAIVMMPAQQAQAGGSALVHHAGADSNPKIVRRPTAGREGSMSANGVGAAPGTGAAAGTGVGGGAKEKEKERVRGDAVANAILVSQVAGLTLEDRGGAGDMPASVPSANPGVLPTKDPGAALVAST